MRATLGMGAVRSSLREEEEQLQPGLEKKVSLSQVD